MRKKSLQCPACFDGDELHRSRMRLRDWPLRLVGLRPYRCLMCNTRFHARGAVLTHARRHRTEFRKTA